MLKKTGFRRIMTYLILTYLVCEALFIDKIGMVNFSLVTLVGIIFAVVMKWVLRNASKEKKEITYFVVPFSALLVVLLISALHIS